jgi:hypothetical protein
MRVNPVNFSRCPDADAILFSEEHIFCQGFYSILIIPLVLWRSVHLCFPGPSKMRAVIAICKKG